MMKPYKRWVFLRPWRDRKKRRALEIKREEILIKDCFHCAEMEPNSEIG